MLERVRQIIVQSPNRQAFFELVGRYFPLGSEGYLLIERAYNVAKEAFRGDVREGNGERYFEHLRAVALIVMVYMRVRDANVIAAALLHDIIEDKADWSQERVALGFNRKVAELVWWVTKPQVGLFNGDKEERNRAYHHNLGRAPREAIIIKLADRLHNLLTMWAVDVEKQQRKIRETQDFYLPLAEKHILLIHEIEDALRELMNGLSK
jgi:GTP pyrophosphokinase